MDTEILPVGSGSAVGGRQLPPVQAELQLRADEFDIEICRASHFLAFGGGR